MTFSLKHAFQSTKADGADTSIVRPSDWNAEHTLSMATDRLLGRTTAGAGAVEEISVGTGLSLTAGALSSTVTGTVTSVALSGGTTGLTVTGSPITSSGTITLAGTLAVANGGTGQTSYTDGQLLIGNTTGNTLAKATLTAGSGVSVTNGSGSITIANTAPMAYPGAGIAISTGSAWGTSKTVPTGEVVGTTDTQTLTNKRITPRVSSTASITSPLALNSDNFDQYAATAQAGNFTINADGGTPTDGQKLIFRVMDNGTPRTITFTGGVAKGFQPVGVTLTASGSNWTYTTTASKLVYFGCVYSASDSRWDIIALSKET